MPEHWFEPLADHMGSAYLRYSFTKGTEQEVTSLIDALGLRPGMTLLDVGCGPGRHTNEFARRGLLAHGVDISDRFVAIAAAAGVPGASFAREDARSLSFVGQYDAAISLCQGAFGLLGTDVENIAVLDGMARSLRPSGRIALTAFSSYFRVKYQNDTDFDAVSGVSHEHTELRNEQGQIAPAELWTTCFTPRELRLLFATVGLRIDEMWSVEPGGYHRSVPTVESPEFLVLGTKLG